MKEGNQRDLFSKDEDLACFVEEFTLAVSHDAHEVGLPPSLKAEALFERFGIDTDQDALSIGYEEKEKKQTRTTMLFSKRTIQLVSCAACFVLMFFGYYKVAQLVSNGDLEGGHTEGMPMGIYSEESDRAVRSVPVNVAHPTDYTMLRQTIVDFQSKELERQKEYIMEAAPAAPNAPPSNDARPNPDTAGGGQINPNTAGGGSANSAVYQTNTQISGIAEADIVKTDGEYIYHARFDSISGDSEVAIVREGNLVKVAEIPIQNAYSTELYLAEEKLVVVSNSNEEETNATPTLGEIAPLKSTQPASKVVTPSYERSKKVETLAVKVEIYNIEDPENPNLVSNFSQNGSYVSSRIKDDQFYLVTQKSAFGDFTQDDILGEEMIPWIARDGEKELFKAEEIIISPYMAGVNYGVVTNYTLSDFSTESVAVLGVTDEIMMSHESLFLSSTLRDNAAEENHRVSTGIVAFDVTSDGLAYRGDALVPGVIDSQFATDEYKGTLRIATTTYGRETENNIYLYDKTMKQIGHLGNMAPGERIYSVRFMEEMAYVVTFKQVDPLFVVDLSDPRKPVIKGELKIPGFSEYLHPIGDGLMVGLGMNTRINPNGGVVTDGIKLSMFDVSNPSDPKELFHHILGNSGSYTEALENHKAFLYYPEKKLIGFPANLYSAQGNQRDLAFEGYLLFEIQDNAFALKGSFPSEEKSQDQWRTEQDNRIKRGVYIGENLTTISDGKLQKYSLSTLKKMMELSY